MPEATCSQHPKPRHAVRTCSVVGEARWCKKEWLLETMASHYKEWNLDGHASGYHALPSVHYPETSYSTGNPTRSYGVPGSYALTLSKKRHAFLRLGKNTDFQEESMTKVAWYAIDQSTPVKSNKS